MNQYIITDSATLISDVMISKYLLFFSNNGSLLEIQSAEIIISKSKSIYYY